MTLKLNWQFLWLRSTCVLDICLPNWVRINWKYLMPMPMAMPRLCSYCSQVGQLNCWHDNKGTGLQSSTIQFNNPNSAEATQWSVGRFARSGSSHRLELTRLYSTLLDSSKNTVRILSRGAEALLWVYPSFSNSSLCSFCSIFCESVFVYKSNALRWAIITSLVET